MPKYAYFSGLESELIMPDIVKRIYLTLITIFMLPNLFGQVATVKGTILEKGSETLLVGVNVAVKDALEGTITDNDGSFVLETDIPLPFRLVVSMIGYQSQEFEITRNSTVLEIHLEDQVYLGQEVVVSASRIPENIMKSPVSVEKLSGLDIQQTSTANFFDGLHQLKGVDMNVHSLTFRYPNTRGFTGEANMRMNQIIDGIENIPPGLSFSAGNIFGVSQLDIDNVELLVGASSALYGPGGVNGTLIMTTKDPYKYQGLSVSVQGGMMNLGADHPYGSNPMGDFNFRYAKSFNNKLAFKITGGYLLATDWHAYDMRDRYNLDDPSSTRENNPGYDGVNVYGDDIIVPVNLKDVAPQVAAGVAEAQGLTPGTPAYEAEVNRIVDLFPNQIVSRTGWQEEDLVDYNTRNMRVGGSLHYRFNNQFEAFVQGNFARGNSVYTAQNRFSLRNFDITNIRGEIKSPDFYFRAYYTIDNSGDTYDAGGAALKLNEAWKPSEQWYEEYISAFTQQLLIGNPESDSHKFARLVADNRDPSGNIFDPAKPALPLPGTEEFNSLFDRIINTPVKQGGAKVIDRSRLLHFEGLYNFSRLVKVVELIAGASARYYSIDSEGTIFIDEPGKPVQIDQYGAFAQVARQLMNERLKLTASARYDKNKFFEDRFTPRVSAVFSLGHERTHHIRSSVQTAFRFPSVADQMVNLDIGPYTVIGGLPEVHSLYNIPENPVYPLSGRNPIIDEPVTENGPYIIPQFRPERVTALEIGYKGLLLNKLLLVDTYIYGNRYNGFTATQLLAQNPDTENEVRYQTTISTDFPVVSYGCAIGAEMRVGRAALVRGNVSYNRLGEINDPPPGFSPQFNTPRYKFNLGYGNRYVTRRIGFNINWRWQESFLWESPFGTATIPAYSMVDAHISLSIPNLKSRLKVGGSNLLNSYYTTSFGSAQIGGLFYISWTYDEILN
jgi:iron complex outermembrane receptor protein